jgi:hypothetical protein
LLGIENGVLTGIERENDAFVSREKLFCKLWRHPSPVRSVSWANFPVSPAKMANQMFLNERPSEINASVN